MEACALVHAESVCVSACGGTHTAYALVHAEAYAAVRAVAHTHTDVTRRRSVCGGSACENVCVKVASRMRNVCVCENVYSIRKMYEAYAVVHAVAYTRGERERERDMRVREARDTHTNTNTMHTLQN